MSTLQRLVRASAALTLLSLLLLAAFAGLRASRPEALEIRWITVTGPFERVTAEQIRAAAAPHVERGFLAVDPSMVSAAVENLPWVQRARVGKDWPDTVRIRVSEQRPLALWGGNRLVSESGELFSVEGSVVPEGLAGLDGPDTDAAEVVVFYREMRRRLAGSGLDVERLRRSHRGAWSARLTGGVELALGKADPLARLDRFLLALPGLEPDLAAGRALLRVDLRYPDGFAVAWREAPPETGLIAAGGR